jgi:hypothetical protein
MANRPTRTREMRPAPARRSRAGSSEAVALASPARSITNSAATSHPRRSIEDCVQDRGSHANPRDQPTGVRGVVIGDPYQGTSAWAWTRPCCPERKRARGPARAPRTPKGRTPAVWPRTADYWVRRRSSARDSALGRQTSRVEMAGARGKAQSTIMASACSGSRACAASRPSATSEADDVMSGHAVPSLFVDAVGSTKPRIPVYLTPRCTW